MSRHFFDCEMRCAVRVRLGYDRPLNEYFLQVERIGADPGQGHSPFLYASIEDPSTVGMTSTTTGKSLRSSACRCPTACSRRWRRIPPAAWVTAAHNTSRTGESSSPHRTEVGSA
jgi:hypothetical protein